jgi:hypothetical protein
MPTGAYSRFGMIQLACPAAPDGAVGVQAWGLAERVRCLVVRALMTSGQSGARFSPTRADASASSAMHTDTVRIARPGALSPVVDGAPLINGGPGRKLATCEPRLCWARARKACCRRPRVDRVSRGAVSCRSRDEGEVVHAGDGLDGAVEAVATLPAVAEDLVVLHPGEGVLGVCPNFAVLRLVRFFTGRQGAPGRFAVWDDQTGVDVRAVRGGSSGRRAAMAMGAGAGQVVPPLTVRMARASNPRGTAAMWVRDRLDELFVERTSRTGIRLTGERGCHRPGQRWCPC